MFTYVYFQSYTNFSFSYTRLAAPAVVVQHNVVIRQEGGFESSGIIEPSGIIESSGIIEPSGIVEPSGIIESSGIIDPGPTDSSIPLGPTSSNSGGAITSHVVSVPTSTLIDAPIFTTTSPAATPTGSGKRSSGGLSKGAIAGIVVGVVVGVFALAAGAFLVWRRHKGRWADRTGASNSNTHDLPESVGAETRMKTMDESSGGGVLVKPKHTQSATNNSTADPNDRYNVTSLPELISIENRDGTRQQPSSTAKRKEQTGPDDLRRLEEEERKIAEAITHAEHLERLRIERRAVQARIQEARNG